MKDPKRFIFSRNMKVALGIKAHSGWAAVVVVGRHGSRLLVIDRRRIDLVEAQEMLWAKQPYHAALDLPVDAARDVVRRGVEAAQRAAVREMQDIQSRLYEARHEIAACTVLVPEPMPDWSTDEILAVHFRMHKAEGVLFPDALVRGAWACGLNTIAIPEKQLNEHAERLLAKPLSQLMKTIEVLGKSVGAPWGKDQKSATLAALVGLR